MNVLATFQNGPWKFTDVRALNSDFPCAKLQKAKKNRHFLSIMKKNEIYIDLHLQPYICTKFGYFCLKNELRNVKSGRLIKWSIMRIFNETEPPWSNLFEILG